MTQTTHTELFESMSEREFEHISFFHDKKTGLRSIIAIHNTKLGPALGGCRFYPYANEQKALADVMNLAQAMTSKAAMAGLELGGGKSVILGDPKKHKTPEILRAFAACVERLGGRYITSVDSGTSSEDLDIFSEVTNHVVGLTPNLGGAGDPSPLTALGVLCGIEAAVEHRYGSSDLNGKKIAVQGVGHVGYTLVSLLREKNAEVVISDIDEKRATRAAQELQVELVSAHEILKIECDVFAPCAMGGVINADTLDTLACSVVAGAANNPLASMDIANALFEKGIVYAPDFVINAGGLIHVAQELRGYDREKVETKTRNIGKTIASILKRADQEKKSPAAIARSMAREIIEA
ncbi:MAG: Glu/Leu/Phe/Val dehydrogenase dimerization domain-containing protein [Bdellovibrionota bacterium]